MVPVTKHNGVFTHSQAFSERMSGIIVRMQAKQMTSILLQRLGPAPSIEGQGKDTQTREGGNGGVPSTF